jgi:hypothetical protein
MHLHYKGQIINSVYGNNHYLFYESHVHDIYTVSENSGSLTIKQEADTVSTALYSVKYLLLKYSTSATSALLNKL